MVCTPDRFLGQDIPAWPASDPYPDVHVLDAAPAADPFANVSVEPGGGKMRGSSISRSVAQRACHTVLSHAFRPLLHSVRSEVCTI